MAGVRRRNIRRWTGGLILLFVVGLGIQGWRSIDRVRRENRVLREIVSRLEADSRIAEVLVTDVRYNPLLQRHMTTIKFLEYAADGRPLEPRYFTFSGNVIQFQSLVVRFDDRFVERGDALRGKSVSLFWKVFFLDGPRTEEFVITPLKGIPEGYKVPGERSSFERRIWNEFWRIALDEDAAARRGVKSAQIEAPGTRFVPGLLYTLRLEHDGGIRIEARRIPEILKGERL